MIYIYNKLLHNINILLSHKHSLYPTRNILYYIITYYTPLQKKKKKKLKNMFKIIRKKFFLSF